MKRALSKDYELIIDYLYGGLDNVQIHEFEQRMEIDPEFKHEVEQQRQLNSIFCPGSKAKVSQSRQDRLHWAVQRKLRQHTRLRNVFNKPMHLSFQLASMVMTFALGILFAQQSNFFKDAPKLSPLAHIQENDYQITDLKLTQDNEGIANAVFSIASRSQVRGSLDSPELLNLFAATLKNEIRDEVRLELIDVIKTFRTSDIATDALKFSLLNDPNPGVRIIAADSLAAMAENSDVRVALRQALENDINTGIRITAFNALTHYLDDQKTLELLEKVSSKDGNLFIRNQSKILMNQLKTPTEINSSEKSTSI